MKEENKKEEKKKSLTEELNATKAPNKNNSSENVVRDFFIGIILLALGLFMLSKRVIVRSSWYIWSIGSFNLSSGLVTVPLIIGIIWYFVNQKSLFAKILIALGSLFIVATIIMGISINFITTSLFEYILIMAITGAGAGLLIKTIFSKKD